MMIRSHNMGERCMLQSAFDAMQARISDFLAHRYDGIDPLPDAGEPDGLRNSLIVIQTKAVRRLPAEPTGSTRTGWGIPAGGHRRPPGPARLSHYVQDVPRSGRLCAGYEARKPSRGLSHLLPNHQVQCRVILLPHMHGAC
jgi:hypothetical protein